MSESEPKDQFIDDNPELIKDRDITILPDSAREYDVQTGVKYYARVANVEPYGIFVSLAVHEDWDLLQGYVPKELLPPLTSASDFVPGDEVVVAKVPNGDDERLQFKVMDVLDSIRQIELGSIDIAFPEGTEPVESSTDDTEEEPDLKTRYGGNLTYKCPKCDYTADHQNVVRTHITYSNDKDHNTTNGFLDDVDVIALDGDEIVGTVESPGQYPNDDWVSDYWNPPKDTKKNEIIRLKLENPSWPYQKIADEIDAAESYPYTVLGNFLTMKDDDEDTDDSDDETHECVCGKTFKGGPQLRGHQTHCDLWARYREAGKPDIDGKSPDQLADELPELSNDTDDTDEADEADGEHKCFCGKPFDSFAAKTGHQSTCDVFHRYKSLGKPEAVTEDLGKETVIEYLDAIEAGDEIVDVPQPDTSDESTEAESDESEADTDESTEPDEPETFGVELNRDQIKRIIQQERLLGEDISDAALDALIQQK